MGVASRASATGLWESRPTMKLVPEVLEGTINN